MTQRSSWFPPASTASSKTPPGTLGPCVIESTRIGGDSSEAMWTRRHAFGTLSVAGTGVCRQLRIRLERVMCRHADRYVVHGAGLQDAHDGAAVRRARLARRAHVRSWPAVRRTGARVASHESHCHVRPD